MRTIERYIPKEMHVPSPVGIERPILLRKQMWCFNFNNIGPEEVTDNRSNRQERETSFTRRLTALYVIVISRYYMFPLSRGCWLRWYSLSLKILYSAQESSRSSLSTRDVNVCRNEDRASASFVIISLHYWIWAGYDAGHVCQLGASASRRRWCLKKLGATL